MGNVGDALGTIAADVTKVTALVDGITKASEEQAQGVEQVNTAVGQMDKVTQQNASGAEESASASEQLASQAQSVKAAVAEPAAIISGQRTDGVGALSDRTPAKRDRVNRPGVYALQGHRKPNSATSARGAKGIHHSSDDTQEKSSKEFPSLDDKNLTEF